MRRILAKQGLTVIPMVNLFVKNMVYARLIITKAVSSPYGFEVDATNNFGGVTYDPASG
jgi:hypothetical protein